MKSFTDSHVAEGNNMFIKSFFIYFWSPVQSTTQFVIKFIWLSSSCYKFASHMCTRYVYDRLMIVYGFTFFFIYSILFHVLCMSFLCCAFMEFAGFFCSVIFYINNYHERTKVMVVMLLYLYCFMQQRMKMV